MHTCLELIGTRTRRTDPLLINPGELRRKDSSESLEKMRKNIFRFVVGSCSRFNGLCQVCRSQPAMVKCLDCIQNQLCYIGDDSTHYKNPLHDREMWQDGCYVPLQVTECLDGGNEVIPKS